MSSKVAFTWQIGHQQLSTCQSKQNVDSSLNDDTSSLPPPSPPPLHLLREISPPPPPPPPPLQEVITHDDEDDPAVSPTPHKPYKQGKFGSFMGKMLLQNQSTSTKKPSSGFQTNLTLSGYLRVKRGRKPETSKILTLQDHWLGMNKEIKTISKPAPFPPSSSSLAPKKFRQLPNGKRTRWDVYQRSSLLLLDNAANSSTATLSSPFHITHGAPSLSSTTIAQPTFNQLSGNDNNNNNANNSLVITSSIHSPTNDETCMTCYMKYLNRQSLQVISLCDICKKKWSLWPKIFFSVLQQSTCQSQSTVLTSRPATDNTVTLSSDGTNTKVIKPIKRKSAGTTGAVVRRRSAKLPPPPTQSRNARKVTTARKQRPAASSRPARCTVLSSTDNQVTKHVLNVNPKDSFNGNVFGYTYEQQVDVLNINGHWYSAKLVSIRGGKVKVSYQDWDDQDEWIIMGSQRLRTATGQNSSGNVDLDFQGHQDSSLDNLDHSDSDISSLSDFFGDLEDSDPPSNITQSKTSSLSTVSEDEPRSSDQTYSNDDRNTCSVPLTVPSHSEAILQECTITRPGKDYVASTLDTDPSQIFNNNEVFMTRRMARQMTDEHGFCPNSFGYHYGRAVAVTYETEGSNSNRKKKQHMEWIGFLRQMRGNQVRVWFPSSQQSDWMLSGSRRLRLLSDKEDTDFRALGYDCTGDDDGKNQQQKTSAKSRRRRAAMSSATSQQTSVTNASTTVPATLSMEESIVPLLQVPETTLPILAETDTDEQRTQHDDCTTESITHAEAPPSPIPSLVTATQICQQQDIIIASESVSIVDTPASQAVQADINLSNLHNVEMTLTKVFELCNREPDDQQKVTSMTDSDDSTQATTEKLEQQVTTPVSKTRISVTTKDAEYLTTGAFATRRAMRQLQDEHGFVPNPYGYVYDMTVEILNTRSSKQHQYFWERGRLVGMRPGKVRVRYEGWGEIYDEWMMVGSRRIRLVDESTQPNGDATNDTATNTSFNETSAVEESSMTVHTAKEDTSESSTANVKSLLGSEFLLPEMNPELQDETKNKKRQRLVLGPDDYHRLGMMVSVEELERKALKRRRGKHHHERIASEDVVQDPVVNGDGINAQTSGNEHAYVTSAIKQQKSIKSGKASATATTKELASSIRRRRRRRRRRQSSGDFSDDNDDGDDNDANNLSALDDNEDNWDFANNNGDIDSDNRDSPIGEGDHHGFIANVYGYDYMQHVQLLHLDKKWYEGRLVSMVRNRLRVHYCGWPDLFDEYVNVGSRRLQVIENNHEVECLEPNYMERYEESLRNRKHHHQCPSDQRTSESKLPTTNITKLRRITLADVGDQPTEGEAIDAVTCHRCNVAIKQFRYYCTYCESTSEQEQENSSFDLCLQCFDHNFPFWHEHPRSSFAIQSVINASVGPRPIKGELVTVWEEDIMDEDACNQVTITLNQHSMLTTKSKSTTDTMSSTPPPSFATHSISGTISVPTALESLPMHESLLADELLSLNESEAPNKPLAGSEKDESASADEPACAIGLNSTVEAYNALVNPLAKESAVSTEESTSIDQSALSGQNNPMPAATVDTATDPPSSLGASQIFPGQTAIGTDQGYKYLKRWQRRKVCAFCNDDDDTSEDLGKFIGPFVVTAYNKNGVEKKRTFWSHDSCARYSPEVFCTPEGKWYNVTLALRRGRGVRCFGCKEKGATIGCFESKCHKSFHLPCAQKPVNYFRNGVIFWCPIHEAYYNKIDTYVNVFNCDGCDKKLEEESWYTCLPCASSYFSSFDLCAECYENFPGDHAHNEDEFEETSFQIIKEMEAQKATEAARAKEEVRAANAKKRKKPVFLRRRRRRADGTLSITCCYCGTQDADEWRKGYDGGVLMCLSCYNLALMVDNDGRPNEDEGLDVNCADLNTSIVTSSSISHTLDQSHEYQYLAAVDNYTHKPYLTRDALSLTKFSDSLTGARLPTYEPQPSQLFSLIFASTYYDIPGRAPRWASHSGTDYHGTWLPQTVRRSLLKYTEKNERVLSNFLGRGTDAIECFLLQRRCVGIDINPAAVALSQRNCCFELPIGVTEAKYRPIVAQSDARNLSGPLFGDESFHHILSHPPYKDCVAYSTHLEGDLSRFNNIEDFKVEYQHVVEESYRMLKMGRRLTLGIGDNREHCFYIPVSFHLMRQYIDEGFELEELIVKRQRYCSAFGLGTYLCVQFDFLVFTHEFLATFRKIPKEKIDRMTGHDYMGNAFGDQNVRLTHTIRGVPSSPVLRKSVVMGTVWVFRPTDKYSFSALCMSRMVERFGKDGHNWQHVQLDFMTDKKETLCLLPTETSLNAIEKAEVEQDDTEISSYEQERLKRIDENNKLLLKLGLVSELGEESDDVIHYDTMMNKPSDPDSPLCLMIMEHPQQLTIHQIDIYRQTVVQIALEAITTLPPLGMLVIGTQDIRDQQTGKLWPLSILVLEDIEKALDKSVLKLKEMVVTVPDGHSRNRKQPISDALTEYQSQHPNERHMDQDVIVVDDDGYDGVTTNDYLPIVHAIYLVFQRQ